MDGDNDDDDDIELQITSHQLEGRGRFSGFKATQYKQQVCCN